MFTMCQTTLRRNTIENMQWKMWTGATRNMFHQKYVASCFKSETQMQRMCESVKNYNHWQWTTVHRCMWKILASYFFSDAEWFGRNNSHVCRLCSTAPTGQCTKNQWRCKAPGCTFRGDKALFQMWRNTQKHSNRQNGKEKCNTCFMKCSSDAQHEKNGLAKHRDAQSAGTNHCFKCGATTYKNVRTTRTGSQTEPTEDKNATNVFPNGVRMHTSASCESWMSPRTLWKAKSSEREHKTMDFDLRASWKKVVML